MTQSVIELCLITKIFCLSILDTVIQPVVVFVTRKRTYLTFIQARNSFFLFSYYNSNFLYLDNTENILAHKWLLMLQRFYIVYGVLLHHEI